VLNISVVFIAWSRFTRLWLGLSTLWSPFRDWTWHES